jgi:hypothetical protein
MGGWRSRAAAASCQAEGETAGQSGNAERSGYCVLRETRTARLGGVITWVAAVAPGA